MAALLISALLFGGSTSAAGAEDPRSEAAPGSGNLATQINMAGRQRMLTQRIVKSYVQAVLGVEPVAARQQIQDSLQLFQAQLDELRGSPGSEPVLDALRSVERGWEEFRQLAGTEPDATNIKDLLESSERLLTASERLVSNLVSASSVAIAELVNVAGRQRMLSQRFAKLYMLLAADLADSSILEELAQTQREFEEAMRWLSASPQNTPASSEVLQDMVSQWMWLDSSMQIESDKYYPWIVADVSEKVLLAAERLTEIYAQTAR